MRYLAEHPERLVTREELLKVVWQHNFVSDGLLRGYICELRQVLGDDAKARASSRPRAGGVTGSSPRSLPLTRVPSGGALPLQSPHSFVDFISTRSYFDGTSTETHNPVR